MLKIAIIVAVLAQLSLAQLGPGDHTLTIEGRPEGTRRLLVHVPQSYTRAVSVAVVFSWHGYSDNCQHFGYTLSGFTPVSDANGFIAVYPCGTGSVPSFNAGVCCGGNRNDDVEFARLTINSLRQQLPKINASRIFTSGFSNGGMMSEQLGCRSSALFRAIASTGGTTVLNPGWVTAFDECDKVYTGRQAAVLLIHGTADPTVPFNGNQRSGFPPVPADHQRWAQRNKCTGNPVETFRRGPFHNDVYQNCPAGPVELVRHEGGMHVWPNTTDFRTPEYIWQFFAKF